MFTCEHFVMRNILYVINAVWKKKQQQQQYDVEFKTREMSMEYKTFSFLNLTG